MHWQSIFTEVKSNNGTEGHIDVLTSSSINANEYALVSLHPFIISNSQECIDYETSTRLT